MVLLAGLAMTACTAGTGTVSPVAGAPPVQRDPAFQLARYDGGPSFSAEREARIERVRAMSRRWSCVPFARELTGLDIRGDAWQWWERAAGRYGRGRTPAVGSVLVLRKTGHLRHGHVAVVSRIVNRREIVVDHANWGWNRATRGRANWQMRVKDVSDANDWSQTRFWYEPANTWGTRTYPAHGFIYPEETMVAEAAS